MCQALQELIKDEIEEVYGELVGISKISIELYKEMIKQYREKTSDLYYSEDDENVITKYDYENAIFDAAQKRRVGYLKIENLIWGEVDDRHHLQRIKNNILPQIEKITTGEI